MNDAGHFARGVVDVFESKPPQLGAAVDAALTLETRATRGLIGAELAVSTVPHVDSTRWLTNRVGPDITALRPSARRPRIVARRGA